MIPITSIPVRPRTVVWAPCAICWGQRRIFEDANGEGLVPRQCPGCLGMGDTARVT
jgi:hypothetical protein